MKRFAERVAVITGGAQGIGGATALQLAAEGAKVLIADIDMDSAASTVKQIKQAGGVAEALRVDVGQHQDIKAMVQEAVDLWGRLDILINNAFNPAHTTRGSALDITDEVWEQDFTILLKSLFWSAKYAVPEMQKQSHGSIVNISSVRGLLVSPGGIIYDTAKAAVNALTRQLAVEFGPAGIRVNAICPGHILTERAIAGWQDDLDKLRLYEQMYPLRRCGTPEDIANAAVFLCSHQANFITGHTLIVDGGLTVQLQDSLAERLA